jgi:hypothetical protein
MASIQTMHRCEVLINRCQTFVLLAMQKQLACQLMHIVQLGQKPLVRLTWSPECCQSITCCCYCAGGTKCYRVTQCGNRAPRGGTPGAGSQP